MSREPIEPRADWEVLERMPAYNDRIDFDVVVNDEVRRVRRIGNRSPYYAPGTLVFVDCTHPLQNALCDERRVSAWRPAASGALAQPVDNLYSRAHVRLNPET